MYALFSTRNHLSAYFLGSHGILPNSTFIVWSNDSKLKGINFQNILQAFLFGKKRKTSKKVKKGNHGIVSLATFAINK